MINTTNPVTSFRRRVVAGVAVAVAVFGVGVEAAGAQSTSVTSSYGASLSAQGYCGGPGTGFTINAYGFEYARMVIWSPTYGWVVGQWTAVPQVYGKTVPLPIATPGNYYFVQGADWTSQGFDIRTAVVGFTRVPSFTYSTWFC